jgi:hypothetical protein
MAPTAWQVKQSSSDIKLIWNMAKKVKLQQKVLKILFSFIRK